MTVSLEDLTPLEFAILNMEDAAMVDASEHIRTGSLRFGQLSIPRHIDLAGDSLYYWDDIDYSRGKADATGVLDAFVRIKTPNDILRFARRYGPLGLCEHGLPPMHRVEGGASERKWCAPCVSEPIEKWLGYSQLALSYLNGAAVLKVDTGKRMRGLRQLFLQDGINEWLGDAGVELELNWDRQEPVLTLTGNGVFGALGVELLMAVTANTLAVCSGCGRPYLRKGRKPKPGEHNFCPDCGSKVANKLRQRDLQERLRKIKKGAMK